MPLILSMIGIINVLAGTAQGQTTLHLLPYRSISAARNRDGRLEAFGIDQNRHVQHKWQYGPGTGWTDWTPMGGSNLVSVAAATNADGRLEVFAADGNGHVQHAWQYGPGSGNWSNWTPLSNNGGKNLVSVAAATNADGRLEVFATDTYWNVQHTWQYGPGSGNWSNWGQMSNSGGSASIAAATNADGRLEVFVNTYSRHVRHAWQYWPGSGWTDWTQLGSGGFGGGIAAVTNADGRLEVFTVGGSVQHIWQYGPGSGNWSNWTSLGGRDLTAVAAATNADGRLEVFSVNTYGFLASHGNPKHSWQLWPGGNWSDLFDL